MGKVSGFTQLGSSMVKLLDIDGIVHSGCFTVLTQDVLILLLVTLPLLFTK